MIWSARSDPSLGRVGRSPHPLSTTIVPVLPVLLDWEETLIRGTSDSSTISLSILFEFIQIFMCYVLLRLSISVFDGVFLPLEIVSLLWFSFCGRKGGVGRCCFGFGFCRFSLGSCASGVSIIWDLFWKLFEMGRRGLEVGFYWRVQISFNCKRLCFLLLLVLDEL